MNESVGYQRRPSNIFFESHELPVGGQLEGLLGLDAAVVVKPVPLLRHLQCRILLAVPLVWSFNLQIQTYKCCICDQIWCNYKNSLPLELRTPLLETATMRGSAHSSPLRLVHSPSQASECPSPPSSCICSQFVFLRKYFLRICSLCMAPRSVHLVGETGHVMI